MAKVEPSDEFKEAARAKVQADKLLERRRAELQALIAAEVERGVNLSTIGKLAGYTPEHVRRIARAHGVEGSSSRTPPAAKRPSKKAMERFVDAINLALHPDSRDLVTSDPAADIEYTTPDGHVLRLEVKYVPHPGTEEPDSH